MMCSKSLKLYNCKINNVPTTIFKDGAIIFDSIRNWIQKSHTSSTFQVKFSFLNNSSQEKKEIAIFKIILIIKGGSLQKKMIFKISKKIWAQFCLIQRIKKVFSCQIETKFTKIDERKLFLRVSNVQNRNFKT